MVSIHRAPIVVYLTIRVLCLTFRFKREDMWSQQHSGNYKFYYKYLLEDKWILENYCLLWETLSATLYDNMMDYVYNLRDSIGLKLMQVENLMIDVGAVLNLQTALPLMRSIFHRGSAKECYG